MGIRVETESYPAFLASALVNGDLSGLESAEDLALLDSVLRDVAPGRVVSAEGDSYFADRYLPATGHYFAGDWLDYTIHYDTAEPDQRDWYEFALNA